MGIVIFLIVDFCIAGMILTSGRCENSNASPTQLLIFYGPK